MIIRFAQNLKTKLVSNWWYNDVLETTVIQNK